MSKKKSEFIVSAGESSECELRIGDVNIKQVQTFIYVGYVLTGGGKYITEIAVYGCETWTISPKLKIKIVHNLLLRASTSGYCKLYDKAFKQSEGN